MKVKNNPWNKTKKNLGMSFDETMNICRGCMATGCKMINANIFKTVFSDLTGITISVSDGLPQVLCFQCSALLQKYIKFRIKILKSHQMLTKYVQDGTPFGQDEDGNLQLSCTEILSCEVPSSQVEQLQHFPLEEQSDVAVVDDIAETACIKMENEEIKEECASSDYEDHFIEDYCIQDELFKEDPLENLAVESEIDQQNDKLMEYEAAQLLKPDVIAGSARELLRTPDHIYENTRARVRRKLGIATPRKDSTDSTSNEHKETDTNSDKAMDGDNLQTIHQLPTRTKAKRKGVRVQRKPGFATQRKITANGTSCRKNETDQSPQVVEANPYKANDVDSFLTINTLSNCKKEDSTNNNNKVETVKDSCQDCKVNDNLRHKLYSYFCDICNQSFYTHLKLIAHIRTHLDKKRYVCDVCEQSFYDKYSLFNHSSTHIKAPLECDICSKRFTSRNKILMHMPHHYRNNNFICHICGMVFKNVTKRYIYVHIARHTRKKPMFECDTCARTFMNRYEIRKHIRTEHTEKKSYKCGTCSKSFKNRHILKRHSVVHTGDKQFKCEICNKLFSVKNKLTLHMRIHTGEKPFECDMCAKRFSRKCTLIEHFRKHTGEKPFQCEICMKRFSQRTSRNTHYRTHERDKTQKRTI